MPHSGNYHAEEYIQKIEETYKKTWPKLYLEPPLIDVWRSEKTGEWHVTVDDGGDHPVHEKANGFRDALSEAFEAVAEMANEWARKNEEDYYL